MKKAIILCIVLALFGQVQAKSTHETQTKLISEFHGDFPSVINPNILPELSQISQDTAYQAACDCIDSRLKGRVAYIRQGASVPADEIKVIRNRLPRLKAGIEKLINQKISYRNIPNTSIFMSGGGYRAMISSLGLLMGFAETGLMDTVWYMAGLSGSTWAIANWLIQNRPFNEYYALLKKQTSKHLFATPISTRGVLEILLRKVLQGQKVSIVDIWGILLGNVFFRNLSSAGKDIHLTHLADRVRPGHVPFPLLTSIAPSASGYQWAEFSPFEVGIRRSKAFTPAYAFGSKYNKGICKDIDPEQTLGFILGLCGSAFAINCKDALRHFQHKLKHPLIIPIIEKIIHKTKLGDIRATTGKVHNFLRHLDQSQLAQEKSLKLLDAGIDFNLPIPPLLRRSVDIYIAIDVSETLHEGRALRNALEYAYRYGVKMPKVNFRNIDKKPISVFSDDNPTTPIVIYIPNMKKYSTLKFQYSSSEFDDLCFYMRDVIVQSKNKIVAAIAKKVGQLKKLNRTFENDEFKQKVFEDIEKAAVLPAA